MFKTAPAEPELPDDSIGDMQVVTHLQAPSKVTSGLKAMDQRTPPLRVQAGLPTTPMKEARATQMVPLQHISWWLAL